MKSARRGSGTLVEERNVKREGFSLLIRRKKRFVRFDGFPWFRDASIAQITNVTLPSPHHLYWPELDVDLAVESLDHPERFPLVSRARPNKRLQPTKARRPPQGARGHRSRLRG